MSFRPRVFNHILCACSLFVPVAVKAQRLPGGVHPEHYSLTLTPDLKAATFTGTETIDLTLDAPSTTVTLNAAEIKFVSVSSGSQSAAVTLDAAKEQATFIFPQELSGKVTLAVTYTGILNDKLRGFYLSKTKLRNYAVTQFEPTDARRAYPSFDEPEMKATYDITLVVDQGDTAISNTNILSDRAGPIAGKHTIKFATTPRMSTYLVAFLVGDFVCTKGKADGVPIRGCATPDKVKLTRFAVQSAEYILKYYDTYFGIKYPMPKLDMVALPDFEAGAMENFGCITYRETDLLVDAKHGPVPAKKRVAVVVAHEMAHQWFGDMVTMQWWDNLWLNEGFATWMETKPVAKWHPEWNYPLDDAEGLDGTLNYDSGPTTRAIRAKADTPAEINEQFDGIAYGKAGAVLGMVENYLGEELFRQGVHNYLQAHLYANATAEDFWNAQTANSGQPVNQIMQSFVVQPGVPLLTLSNQQRTGQLAVEQRRFFLAQSPEDTTGLQWTVPVCFKGAACQLLTPGKNSLTVPAGLAFVDANARSKGYYRTEYTPDQVAAIVPVAETALTPPERIGLLGDRWALVRAGQASVGDYLDLVLALKQDPNAAVLETASAKVAAIESRIATEEDRKALDAVLREQYGPVYSALGKQAKHEGLSKEDLRGALFELLGTAEHAAVLAQARQITNDLFAQHKNPDSALADAAISLSAANGDAALYDLLLAVSQNATDPGLKTQALFTLTRFKAANLVQRTLDYAVSGQVRNQDSWILIANLLGTPATRDQAWAYVRQNWPRVSAQFTTNSGVRIVAATGTFCTVTQRDEVVSFFHTHPVEAAERTLRKSIDSINDCVAFRAAQEPNLHHWLAAHSN